MKSCSYYGLVWSVLPLLDSGVMLRVEYIPESWALSFLVRADIIMLSFEI